MPVMGLIDFSDSTTPVSSSTEITVDLLSVSGWSVVLGNLKVKINFKMVIFPKCGLRLHLDPTANVPPMCMAIKSKRSTLVSSFFIVWWVLGVHSLVSRLLHFIYYALNPHNETVSHSPTCTGLVSRDRLPESVKLEHLGDHWAVVFLGLCACVCKEVWLEEVVSCLTWM